MGNSANEEEKWEFASLEWCQFAGELGARLIQEANLDLSKYEWGFSEHYLLTPERLMAGRDKAAYYFMITGGKVSGGAGLPEECLALPGFHVSPVWAMIAHPSAVIYGREGQKQRGIDGAKLNEELAAAGISSPKKAPPKAAEAKPPRCHVCGSPDHDRADCPVWPPGIGEALSVDSENGGGLHNITAKRLKRSPELDDLPETESWVPIFSKMTDEQKSRFLKLIGR